MASPHSHTLAGLGTAMFRVRCDACQRRGAYRADRLMAQIGDLTLSNALTAVGTMGKCPKALNPPVLNEMHYQLYRCQIRLDAPAPKIPPSIGRAMHEKWRGYIICARHHQGLKRARPCGVEAELDLPTLVASLGYDFEIARLNATLRAPCCGTHTFELRWYKPEKIG